MPKHTKEFLDKTRLEKTDDRYTLSGMIRDEIYNLVHLERIKFIYTAWDLTVKPAQSIHMVLSGYRKYLYPYFSYLLLIGTITIFLTVRYKFFVSGYDIGDQHTLLEDILNFMGFHREFRLAFFEYAEQFATLVNIVALPVFSLVSWMFFPSCKFNIGEHFILNVYICAQQLLFLWFTIPFLEFTTIPKDIVIGVYTALTVMYNVWVYATLFAGKLVWNIFKSILAVMVAFILQTPVNYGVFYLLRPFIKWLDAIF